VEALQILADSVGHLSDCLLGLRLSAYPGFTSSIECILDVLGSTLRHIRIWGLFNSLSPEPIASLHANIRHLLIASGRSNCLVQATVGLCIEFSHFR
jgi:hypothetical protein